MNRSLFAASCGALILGLLSWATSGVEASGDPARGKSVYEKNCLVCHGPQGKGDGPSGKVLKPPAADLTGASSKEKSETEIRQVIENGKPGTGMGPWKSQLKQAELNDVLEYVMSLRK